MTGEVKHTRLVGETTETDILNHFRMHFPYTRVSQLDDKLVYSIRNKLYADGMLTEAQTLISRFNMPLVAKLDKWANDATLRIEIKRT